LSTEFYLVGRVRRAHGIRGELVVESLTDAPDAIFAPGRRVFAGTRGGDVAKEQPELHILRSSPFKGGWIIAFDGINDRTAAETWRDRTLLLPESEVEPPEENEVFIHDLVGMRVVRVSGEELGEVSEVFELPQGLVFEVERPGAKPVLLPFNEQTVAEVDSDARLIRVDPLEGLID
jgi:16S rRNA processing protein RimM